LSHAFLLSMYYIHHSQCMLRSDTHNTYNPVLDPIALAKR
jgi:hypothetical protein